MFASNNSASVDMNFPSLKFPNEFAALCDRLTQIKNNTHLDVHIEKFELIESICKLDLPFQARAFISETCIAILDQQEKNNASIYNRRTILSILSTCVHAKFDPHKREMMDIIDFEIHAEEFNQLPIDQDVIVVCENSIPGRLLRISERAKVMTFDENQTRSTRLEWFNYGQMALEFWNKILSQKD